MTPASRVLEKPPWTMAQVLTWFLVAQVGPMLIFVFLVGVFYADSELPEATPIWFLAATSSLIWVGYGAGTIIETVRRGKGPEIELGLMAPFAMYVGAAVIGAITQLVLLPILYWPIVKLNPELDVGEAAETLVAEYDTAPEILVFALIAVIAAPVVEELFYRGLMLRGLTHYMPASMSVVLTALIFAAVHLQLVQLPGLFLVGLIAGTIVLYTGRVGLSIAMHMAFNLTAVIGLFWL
jgi:membrane protease YdiL (CAAX protease family)